MHGMGSPSNSGADWLLSPITDDQLSGTHADYFDTQADWIIEDDDSQTRDYDHNDNRDDTQPFHENPYHDTSDPGNARHISEDWEENHSIIDDYGNDLQGGVDMGQGEGVWSNEEYYDETWGAPDFQEGGDMSGFEEEELQSDVHMGSSRNSDFSGFGHDDLLSIASQFSPPQMSPFRASSSTPRSVEMQVDNDAFEVSGVYSQSSGQYYEQVSPTNHGGSSGRQNRETSSSFNTLEDVRQQLQRQSQALIEFQQYLESRLSTIVGALEDLSYDRHPTSRSTRKKAPRVGKDSSLNYLRRCIRAHVKLRFGMSATQILPDRPPQNVVIRELGRINNGEEPHNPFLPDLGDSLSSDWNLCVRKYFFRDFWASVEGHVYNDSQIPSAYRKMETFAVAYNTHMGHLQKNWKRQQLPADPSAEEAKRKHDSRNSRIGTFYKNRRDAAAHLPPDISGPLVSLIDRIGTAGISSDEEIPGSRPPQYSVFEKPWRADALLHLYRHLDLIHAATRNPNGNPIRTRHRTMRTRNLTKPPKGLPKDCINARYWHNISILEREFLALSRPVGVDRLLTEVQRLAI